MAWQFRQAPSRCLALRPVLTVSHVSRATPLPNDVSTQPYEDSSRPASIRRRQLL
jgi:hypothetical protein